jgi:hypothetical protein
LLDSQPGDDDRSKAAAARSSKLTAGPPASQAGPGPGEERKTTMLGQYKFIPAKDASMLILFMQHGQVLAVATETDEKIDAIVCAELTARVLLNQFQQFDGAIIVPFQYGQDQEGGNRRLSKRVRRAAKRAYKEGEIK